MFSVDPMSSLDIVKHIVFEIFLPKIKESAVSKNINLVMKQM